MPTIHHCDLAIVGGGLSGALIALAAAKRRPDARIRLIEGAATFGGNHVWSFFGSDVPGPYRALIAPLVTYGWRAYDIAFPAHARTIDTTYYSITSDRLDEVVRAALPPESLMTRARVLGASPTAVVLADGDRVEAQGVIDCRGPGDTSLLDLGWQKFMGMEVRTAYPHGVERPIVMDGSVEQHDGFRFVYTLPFDATTLFIEDTYYSDTPDLDTQALAGRISAYAEAKGWPVATVGRSETGVLPVAMGGDFEEYWRSGGNRVAKGGMRAGLFHPLTGYSLPDALRLAHKVADSGDWSGGALHTLTHDVAAGLWRERGFYRMLATMLFKAAEPEERYRVLERFYRLDPKLVARFYGGRSTIVDKARVLIGKPPVPIGRAVAALMGRTG
ncbi:MULTISPECIES: lycopene beta-cyclase CrtY [unclassified Sphingomonas]|uniref:lycopene beta-cyclase CrtY n=1 Tax=unclassified Sphingomonas TaxID=196159 RepID=UPI0006FB0179|nr:MULTISPECIES: lycopene beta-cyclase CrtY [unclassified Sphingomonas]KQM96448.1 lycopene cyclase [Sphingomonas sp. Leaf25]KQN35694.1 lycopene cyclase [Sphingomonas sp. Leaf42]KQT26561.1 lycopene cyclase [Sphingomonas sp. Leaf407]